MTNQPQVSWCSHCMDSTPVTITRESGGTLPICQDCGRQSQRPR